MPITLSSASLPIFITALNFSTSSAADTTAPILQSLSPVDNATSVAAGSNLVLTFSEAVRAGSGNITLFNANGTVARTISVMPQISSSGKPRTPS